MRANVPKSICVLFALLLPTIGGAAEAARVWEAPLVIPTYELGPPDPNPIFPALSQQDRRPIYPYPALDSLTERRVEKRYEAIYLENEFLRVIVLPELGGHLYSIYDKSARRESLYTNHVIKYGLVAIRGAWVSGGIEWNFPDGHTATTVSPIDYTLRMEPDGSAVAIVGDTERIQRMQWAVAIRLRPGTKFVETEVTLNNRREVPGRYWYWATAAAPATDDLRFVYPMRETYPHTFWPVFSFPVHEGVDLSTYRAVPNPLSLFARNSKRDFFGVYYEKSDWGIVHVADHRDLAGKKTWTWGTDPIGTIWIDKLTDKDGQYVEFQAGRFETQMEHEFIAPHRVEHFVEYWIPLDRLGGPFDEANRDAALRCSLSGLSAQLAIRVTSRFEDAEIRVERGGETVALRKANLTPTQLFSSSIDLAAKGTGKQISVTVKSNDGRVILSWRSDTPIDGNPDFKPASKPQPEGILAGSAEQAWREGVAADKTSGVESARAAWREALRRDPAYSPALISLGLSYYRSGQYEEALEPLESALRRNKDSAEAHYISALALRALGRTRAAADHLIYLVRSGSYEASARCQLAEAALSEGDTKGALEHFSEVLRHDPDDIKARTLLALTLRLAGRLEDAQAQIELVGGVMPLDYLALSERVEILNAAGKKDEAAKTAGELWRLLAREADSVLELAFDYTSVGRNAEARAVLEEAAKRATSARRPVYPLIHYALGNLLDGAGDKNAALAQWELGMRAYPAFVFPHRPEEVRALKSALAVNPADGRAAYYLGNALASLDRVPEAMDAWRSAVKSDPANYVAWRNLALGLWRLQGNKPEAAAALEKAISLASDDFHLYVELDSLMKEMRDPARRVRLLEGAPESVRARSTVVEALAAAYVDAGRFADALNLLDRGKITSGEGESGALAVFRRACIGLATDYGRQGKHREAAVEFLRATQYPPNLGVGRSSAESHAREYAAAAREYEALGDLESAKTLWQRAAAEPLRIPSEPNEPWSENYYWKALALDRSGQKPAAQKLYARLAALSDDRAMEANEAMPPRGAIRWLLAALGLNAIGKADDARSMLNKVLELEPDNSLARSELARLPSQSR